MAGPAPASILPMHEAVKPVPSRLVQPGMQGGSMRNHLRLTALCAFAALAGFDFIVDTEPVVFDLYIDGLQYVDRVYFPATDRGGQVSSTAAFPFGLVTN